jgi:hypothetical protein
MHKVSGLEIVGLVAFFGLLLAFELWRSSPSVSGSLRIDGVEYQAEQCSGFADGVQIFLAGDGYHSIIAGITADGSMLMRFDGRDVASCADARLDAAEGRISRGRSGSGRPVIGGTLSIDCISQRGERLEGHFEFDRCRQD